MESKFSAYLTDLHCLEPEERYEYLYDMGRGFKPTLEFADRDLIASCQSTTWFRAESSDGQVTVSGQSESMIVQGLIALLSAAYNNLSIADAKHLQFFEDLQICGLNLTLARSQSLKIMLSRIQDVLS